MILTNGKLRNIFRVFLSNLSVRAYMESIMSFYEKKMKHFFKFLDATKDGVINADDISAQVNNLMTREGYSLDSQEAIQAKALHEGVYGQLIQDADVNNDGVISPDEFVDYWNGVLEMVKKDDPAAKPILNYFYMTIDTEFEVMDKDSSGTIGFDEYVRYIESYDGIVEFDRQGAFSSFDKNNDEQLSIGEVHQIFKEFFLMDDVNADGNWFYGKF